jgi:hypothetical protein
MPLGLGKIVILEYIEVALVLFVVNDIGVAGSVSKRKVWRRGPNHPWGSIARGMRTMLRVRSSRIVVSPTIMVPMGGWVLFIFLPNKKQRTKNLQKSEEKIILAPQTSRG